MSWVCLSFFKDADFDPLSSLPFSDTYTLENGPYGGDGGRQFTDGGPIHLNGPITAIDLMVENYVTAIRVR